MHIAPGTTGINYGCKSVYSIASKCKCYKTFFLSSSLTLQVKKLECLSLANIFSFMVTISTGRLLGPYSQHLIYFAAYEWLNKLECLFRAGFLQPCLMFWSKPRAYQSEAPFRIDHTHKTSDYAVKMLSGTNPLAYLGHLQSVNNFQCCEHSPWL
jgi:hypothetical protein